MKCGQEQISRRPVIFQTHIDPVPIHVIANNNRTMGTTNKQITDYLDNV